MSISISCSKNGGPKSYLPCGNSIESFFLEKVNLAPAPSSFPSRRCDFSIQVPHSFCHSASSASRFGGSAPGLSFFESCAATIKTARQLATTDEIIVKRTLSTFAPENELPRNIFDLLANRV